MVVLFSLLLAGAAVVSIVSIPYTALYPERHFNDYDFGTERQQEVMRRFRRFASRVSFRRRCGLLMAVLFRKRRVCRLNPPDHELSPPHS
jgi:hypothetical protein